MKIAIIGAGMAGLYLCEYLHSQKDLQLTVFHNDQPDMASRGQSFLFHPFPGRSLEILPHLKEAVTETTKILESWAAFFPQFIRSQPMFRPFKGTNGSRLEKSYQKWWKASSENWVFCEEYSTETLKNRSPLFLPYSAIAYTPAFVVDFNELRKALIQDYQKNGLPFIQDSIDKIQNCRGKWLVGAHTEQFDHVILALGTASKKWFPDLKLTTQGGSLLRLQMKEALSHLFSLDGLHIGEHHSGDWVIGSTRWHQMPTPDSEIQKLKEKLHTMFPMLSQGDPTSLWSGNRCIYPSDRLPLCGELPHQKGIHVLTALGSKGMLWGPFSAKKLCLSILNNDTIPENINLMRANQEDGWFSKKIT